MNALRMDERLDEVLARAAATLVLAREIHDDLEAGREGAVPGCLWRR